VQIDQLLRHSDLCMVSVTRLHTAVGIYYNIAYSAKLSTAALRRYRYSLIFKEIMSFLPLDATQAWL